MHDRLGIPSAVNSHITSALMEKELFNIQEGYLSHALPHNYVLCIWIERMLKWQLISAPWGGKQVNCKHFSKSMDNLNELFTFICAKIYIFEIRMSIKRSCVSFVSVSASPPRLNKRMAQDAAWYVFRFQRLGRSVFRIDVCVVLRWINAHTN